LFKNNDWHFVRCSITQDDYLIEAPQEIFTQFKELQQQQKNYWVSVLAEVNEQQNGNLILKIEKIDEVHLGETCHLLEALKILKIESNHHSRFITNSSISINILHLVPPSSLLQQYNQQHYHQAMNLDLRTVASFH
jgi:hypothetical protein